MSSSREVGPGLPAIKRLWDNAWEEFIPFLDYWEPAPNAFVITVADRMPAAQDR